MIYEETPGLGAKRFRAQLDENPKSDVARYGLAIAQIKGGQLNEARENLKQLLAKSPNEIIYNLAQVDLDITNNRLPDAQSRVDRMLTQYPGNYPLNSGARRPAAQTEPRRPTPKKHWKDLLKSAS